MCGGVLYVLVELRSWRLKSVYFAGKRPQDLECATQKGPKARGNA